MNRGFFMVGLSSPESLNSSRLKFRRCFFGAAAMLEVHPAPDGFTVYDTDAGEAVIKFASRAEADEMIATLQIADVHSKLQRWAPDAVPLTY
jgi:hypothetical protein